jgi:hypothetical protein
MGRAEATRGDHHEAGVQAHFGQLLSSRPQDNGGPTDVCSLALASNSPSRDSSIYICVSGEADENVSLRGGGLYSR